MGARMHVCVCSRAFVSSCVHSGDQGSALPCGCASCATAAIGAAEDAQARPRNRNLEAPGCVAPGL
eukprot:9021176-Alexandrium_andersonii.AAC.1